MSGSDRYISSHGQAMRVVLDHDLDTEDRDERRTKAELAERIALVIEVRGNSESVVAKITGLEPGELSRIADGAVDDYSVWELMKLLAILGNDIAISVTHAAGSTGTIAAVPEPDSGEGGAFRR